MNNLDANQALIADGRLALEELHKLVCVAGKLLEHAEKAMTKMRVKIIEGYPVKPTRMQFRQHLPGQVLNLFS